MSVNSELVLKRLRENKLKKQNQALENSLRGESFESLFGVFCQMQGLKEQTFAVERERETFFVKEYA